MLQLINNTPFFAEKTVLLDKDGNQIWVVIVKATFLINENGSTELHPQQEPVCFFPLYSGEAGRSSLLREGEMVFDHPGTDITLLAAAHAPGERPVRMLDVSVSVGPISKTLRVFGDRFWRNSTASLRMTDPEPFTTIPISYERAFGGTNILGNKPDQLERDVRNPIGRGFASSANTLVDQPLPNIEDPDLLIQAWNSHPRPAGLGPILPMWSPRLEYAGTYDAHWQQHRMPLWPEDFNPRYNQAAHPDLVSPEPLRGGEPITLLNLTPVSTLSFRLPRAYLIFTTFTRRSRMRQRVQIDRVIIEPDAQKLVVVWRSSLNCRARARDIVKTVLEMRPYIR